MQSVRFVRVGRPPQIGDLPKPSPGRSGPHQDRGAGVCHSDLHVMEGVWDSGLPSRSVTRMPAGWPRLDKASRGSTTEPVAVYGPWRRSLPRVPALDGELLRELDASRKDSEVNSVSTPGWPLTSAVAPCRSPMPRNAVSCESIPHNTAGKRPR